MAKKSAERLAQDLMERLELESTGRKESLEAYREFLRELAAYVRERIESLGSEIGD